MTIAAHDRSILDLALSQIAAMMTLPLASPGEIASASRELKEVVSAALCATETPSRRRDHLRGVETAIDEMPEEADERVFAIWDIARDTHRFRRTLAIHEASLETEVA